MSEALRLWAILEAEVNGQCIVGMPGVRDPEHPCDVFDPLPEGEHPDGRGDCLSDGHYMCRECRRLSARSETWPTKSCPECKALGRVHEGCGTCGGRGEVDATGFERAH